MRTRLPCFIVTLAFLFILRGLTLACRPVMARPAPTQLRGVSEIATAAARLACSAASPSATAFFRWLADHGMHRQAATNGAPVGARHCRWSIIWWIGSGVVATWVLCATRVRQLDLRRRRRRQRGAECRRAGGAGEDRPVHAAPRSARRCSRCCTVLDTGSADADRGVQKEFEAIIAAVIGGCLLTGGYGSAIGALVRRAHLRHGADRHLLHQRSTATGSRCSWARCC